jgi:major membrane immunogen (membrane-anchored lipoprotein)
LFLRVVCFVCLALAACGKAALKDGVYEGRSGADDTGAWGEVSVTVREGRVAACVFITRQKDGTIKGADYGKINGEISNAGYYEKAQLAVRAMDRYAQEFTETGNLNKVDAVSGATISHDQFTEAVEAALKKARE